MAIDKLKEEWDILSDEAKYAYVIRMSEAIEKLTDIALKREAQRDAIQSRFEEYVHLGYNL